MKKLSIILSLIAVLLLIGAPTLSAQVLIPVPTSLAMSAQAGGQAVTATLNLTSSGSSLHFSIVPNVLWLSTSVSQGDTAATVTITANPTGLAPGANAGSLTIFAGGALYTVPVTLTISSIGVVPQSLTFNYLLGSNSFPAAQSSTLSAATSTSFNATASTTDGALWLQVAPTSGTIPAQGSVTALMNTALLNNLAVGTYSGTITITPTSGASLTPTTLQVTLVVTASPQVTVTPSDLTFNYQIGGSNNLTQQTVQLSTNASQPVSYGFTSNAPTWLTVSPAGGTVPANGSTSATVSVFPGSLLPNVYNGTVTLVTSTSQGIPVKLTVSNNPLLNVTVTPLNFTYVIGSPAPAAQTLTPTSTGTALQYTIATSTSNGGSGWLSAPTVGVTPNPFSISVSPAGLAPNTYSGTVTITNTAPGSPSQQVPITLKVTNDPSLTASAPSLSFAYQTGQAAPVPQTVKVSTSTGLPLNYSVTASPSASWLILSGSTSGVTDGVFTVSINTSALAAGLNSGLLTITGTNPASASSTIAPLTIPVSVYTGSAAMITVTPAQLAPFVALVGGQTPAAQVLNLSSTSPTDQVSFNVQVSTATGGTWLFASPASGSTIPPSTGNQASITVAAIPPAGMPAGVYTGTITITATGPGAVAVANSPVTIPVTLQLNSGVLTTSPASLSFTQTAGSTAPVAQTVSVTSNGPVLAYVGSVYDGGLNWLSVTSSAGNTPGQISVSVDGSKLSPGTYQGSVIVLAGNATGSPSRIPVTLTVTSGAFSASPLALSFTMVQSGPAPQAQTVSISGTPGPLPYTVSVSGGAWLSATPLSGNTPGTLQVSANGAGFQPGSYIGSVTIASPGAGGSPVTIQVTLNVVPQQTLTVSPASLSFGYITGQAAPGSQTVQVTSTGVSAPISVAASGGSWLQVTPVTGSTPATLTISVNPQGLAANTYSGTLTITSPNSATPATVTVTLTVTLAPTPVLRAIANAASYSTGAVAPGENIVMFGLGIGPADTLKGTVTNGVVDTTVSDTQVLFDNIPAPIIYVSATQTSVMVPYEIAGRPTTAIRIKYKGVVSDIVTYNVVSSTPGIYTLNQAGNGPGSILNQDYSVNGANSRAPKLSVVAIYMTGEGQTDPAGVNGLVTPLNGSGLKKPQLPVTATVGGRPAIVKYYGSAPGIVSGVMQVNVEIPADAPSDPAAQIVITVGSTSTQSNVTVAVQ